MSKKRVHEIAKEQGVSSKDLLEKLAVAGVAAKVAASSVEEADALRALGRNGAPATATATKPEAPAASSPDGTGASSTPSTTANQTTVKTTQASVDTAPTNAAAASSDSTPAAQAQTGTAVPETGAPEGAPASEAQAAGERVRPTRDSRTGELAPAAAT
ncbi:MAG: translation initiation factor IF-2 N-terminal domain-containing protein, partial [Solirubrobacteraceae bacterium]